MIFIIFVVSLSLINSVFSGFTSDFQIDEFDSDETDSSLSAKDYSKIKMQTKNMTFAELFTGTWKNELNSVLKIKTDNNGNLYGKYMSAVGKANGTYPLVGFYETDSTTTIPSLGFIVHWHNEYMNAHANSVWSGFLINGKLSMQWILSSSPESANSIWKSTNIGRDTFTKQ